MNRSDLIAKVAADAAISKAAANKALDSVMSSITKALKKNQKVTLVGFGAFSTTKRKARMGRNPRTGEAIKIKAAKVPRFSPGKALKTALNK